MSSILHISLNRLAVGAVGVFLALALTFGCLTLRPAPATGSVISQSHPSTGCTQAAAAGDWSYSYTGWIITSSGAIPLAAVGRFTQDATGHFVGNQTRSVAGASAEEQILGSAVVHSDCKAEFRARVYQGGQLQRTAYINAVYTNGGNNIRLIFESLVNPDNSHTPVVITMDADRL
jgi:hypothetical protein